MSRTLPGLGLTGFWGLGFNGWNTENDNNLLMLSALVQGRAKSATTTLPGSPTNGDIYIVKVGDTNAGKIAVRDNGAWVYLTALRGWRMWVDDELVVRTFDGTVWNNTSISSILKTTDTTASTSPTTGALQVAGGAGIGGAVHTGLGFVSNAQMINAWQFGSDAPNIGPIAPSSSSADFAAGTGLILLRENTLNSGAAVFLAGGGATLLMAQTLTGWGTTGAAGTTTPAANKCSLAYNGSSGHRIYTGTNTGSVSRNFSAIGLAVLLGFN